MDMCIFVTTDVFSRPNGLTSVFQADFNICDTIQVLHSSYTPCLSFTKDPDPRPPQCKASSQHPRRGSAEKNSGNKTKIELRGGDCPLYPPCPLHSSSQYRWFGGGYKGFFSISAVVKGDSISGSDGERWAEISQGMPAFERLGSSYVEWRFGFMPVRTSTGYRLLASRCRRCFLATR